VVSVTAGKVAATLAWAALKRWATSHGDKLGEWRGRLACEVKGENLWAVDQDAADPCRLWIPAVGLEYSWGGGGWRSDGPSIPIIGCGILHCTRETFLKSGFLHDFAYRMAGVYAREPGGKWALVETTKRQADVLFRVAVNAEGATRGQEAALYAGVKSSLAMAAWRMWRERERGRKA
jgi:hypothetical protein